MVWRNLSPIPVGSRGVISSFKWFFPVVATRRGRGEGVGAMELYYDYFLRRFCRNAGSEKLDVDIGDVFVDLDDCVNLLSVYSVSN